MLLRAAPLTLLFAAALGATPADTPRSGLDLTGIDAEIRPADDLYRFVNGRWLDTVTIAPDRATAGTFIDLFDRTERDLASIAERAAASRSPRGSPAQQIGDLYASFMDEPRVSELGWTPIRGELQRIAALQTASDFAREAGYLSSISGGGPFGTSLLVDADRSDRFIVQITQGGLLLPNREYYLSDSPSMLAIRSQYRAYLTRIFTLVDRPDAPIAAERVLEVETAIARAQLNPIESRDAARSAGVVTLSELPAAMPGFDWSAWAHAQGIDRIGRISFSQALFFQRFAALVPSLPLDGLKAYLSARHIFWSSPYLAPPFADARYDLFNRQLNGQAESRPRWKVGVSLVNSFLSDAFGRLYVEQHFSRSVKDRAEQLARRIVAAYRATLDDAEWLSPKTKKEAIAKLSRLRIRVGYPDHWRDYSGLEIKRDDLAGNVFRGQRFDSEYRFVRSRGAADTSEWIVGPQTLNGYYVPGSNELVLPAAMLQPPLFDPEVDDAVNYGSVGVLIGHEISHAFDERGRQYDASGEVRRWWTSAEEQEYRRRLLPLVKQFNAYSPLSGETVNGDLTLAENAADLQGLFVALRAYDLSLAGQESPVLDGFTGHQRFFVGFARMWRTRVRDDYMRQWLLNFAYAPYEFRTNGSVVNLPVFHEAFHVQPGDRMYRPDGDRARPW